MLDFLRKEQVSEELIAGVEAYGKAHPVEEQWKNRVPVPRFPAMAKRSGRRPLRPCCAARTCY